MQETVQRIAVRTNQRRDDPRRAKRCYVVEFSFSPYLRLPLQREVAGWVRSTSAPADAS